MDLALDTFVCQHGNFGFLSAVADDLPKISTMVNWSGGVESVRRGSEGSHTKKRLVLAGLRGNVALVSSEFQLSERTACKPLGVERAIFYE